MLKHALFALAVVAVASCDERALDHKHVDPFEVLDKHISHTLAYHYLWPWNQLIRAAAALDAEEYLEEPKIVSDSEKYEVHLKVKTFKPEELKIRVKNRNIVVEGKHQEKNQEDVPFVANHFVQRFVLPSGSKQEEVTAVLKENGVLIILVPKHTVPPPPPEREVPIEVLVSKKEEKVTVQPETEKDIVKDETNVNLTTDKEVKQTKKEEEETKTEKAIKINEENSSATAKDAEPATVTNTPLEQLDMIEATTNHVGKIRKKELKDTVKVVMDNEVVKSLSANSQNQNGLDYALIEE